jgi:hypothetical protein
MMEEGQKKRLKKMFIGSGPETPREQNTTQTNAPMRCLTRTCHINATEGRGTDLMGCTVSSTPRW